MLSRFYCLFIIITLLAAGCKKENNQPLSLTGTWELRATNNGWGEKITYPPGTGNILVFTGNHYNSYVDGLPKYSGTYKTMKGSSSLSGEIANRIIYDGNENDTHTLYRLQNDSLDIWLDAYDAGGSLYVRK